MTSKTIAATLAALLALPPAAFAQCQSNADCRPPRLCLEGACAELKCGKDTDCPEPWICANATCVPPEWGAAATPLSPAEADAPRASGGAPDDEPREAAKIEWVTSREPIHGLYITGASVLGGVWFLDWFFASLLSDDDAVIGYSFIPIAGPIVLARRKDGFRSAWAISAAAQSAGLIMLVLGLTITKEVRKPVVALGEGDDVPWMSFGAGPVGEPDARFGGAHGLQLRIDGF